MAGGANGAVRGRDVNDGETDVQAQVDELIRKYGL